MSKNAIKVSSFHLWFLDFFRNLWFFGGISASQYYKYLLGAEVWMAHRIYHVWVRKFFFGDSIYLDRYMKYLEFLELKIIIFLTYLHILVSLHLWLEDSIPENRWETSERLMLVISNRTSQDLKILLTKGYACSMNTYAMRMLSIFVSTVVTKENTTVLHNISYAKSSHISKCSSHCRII